MSNLYFSHDMDALEDIKILYLIKKYNAFGYGIYWSVIEYLHKATNNGNEIKFKEIIEKLYLKNFGEELDITNCINYCIEIDLLKLNNGVLSSDRVFRNIEQMKCRKEKYSNAGRLGGYKKQENKKKEENER